MPRLRIAALALTASLAAVGIAPAQQPPPPPAPAPAPDPVPTLPKAPIPYDQLRSRPAAPPTAEVEEAKEDAEPAEPMKRPRANAAILQALDKVTAETLRFEVPVGRQVRYKSLVFTVRACETAAPDELTPEAAAYVVIDSEPRPQPGRAKRPARQIFRGWMFATTPSINPLEHPVYDAWLIACRTAAPSPVKR